MEQDNSPRKIQFTVPLLEPHLDPEAAEQVRSRAGWPGTRPAKNNGPPGSWDLGNRLRPPLAVRPWEGDRAQFGEGGVFYPLPHSWSHLSLSVLAPPIEACPRRVALGAPALGEGACLRTRPLPPLPVLHPLRLNPHRSF